MGFLGLGNKGNSVKPNYTGLQIQTSVNTLPIPVVWGTSKLAPNIIWADDFASHATKSSSGGKGGGGDVTGYSYSTSLIMALCEGPIAGVSQVWVDQNSSETLAAAGLTLFTGTTSQSTWGYLSSAHSAAAMAYPATAYVCASNYDLGSSASIPNHNMEVKGTLVGTAPNTSSNALTSSAFDADPAQIIEDFLGNAQYGVPNFPSSSIDLTTLLSSSAATTSGDACFQTYCRALGIGMSPALSDTETASSILARWLQLTNSAAVWSGTTLKFIPYGDVAITANGVTYSPNLTPLYDLDDDDFVYAQGTDPVLISRTDPADAKNVIRLECYDRSNAYKSVPIEARDQNAIELYGLRIDTGITAHEICDITNVAPICAQLILQRGLYIRNSFQFTLSWAYCLLEPMDLVTLTDPALGLNKTVVRIISIEEDQDGELQVTAEEFPNGAAHATLYPKQIGAGNGLDLSIDPGSTNPPVIIEPSPEITTAGQPEVWVAASGGGNWGGCEVWISIDNINFEHAGTITGGSRQGSLTAAISMGSDPDTTDTLAVDLTQSRAELISGAQADADNGRTLICVDGELMAYETATLTSQYQYNLTYIRRGMYGTTNAAHSSGTQFARLDNSVFKYPLPQAYVGQTLYLKFQSFNIYNRALEALSSVTAYTYLTNGKGSYIAPPSGVTITSNQATQSDGTGILTLVVSWTPSAGPLLDSYEVQWKTAAASEWSARIVGGNVSSLRFAPAVSNTTYSARARAISQTGYKSVWANAGDTGSGDLWSTVPVTPTGFSATGGLQSITLNWTANAETNIDSYRVFSAEGHDATFGDAALVASVFATTWTHSNLGFGETRSYWLEAVNVAGASSPAGPAYGTTNYDIDAAAFTQVANDPYIKSLSQQLGTNNDALNNLVTAVGKLLGHVNATITQATEQLATYTDNALSQEAVYRIDLSAAVGENSATISSNYDTLTSITESSATDILTLQTLVDTGGSVSEAIDAAKTDAISTATDASASDATSQIATFKTGNVDPITAQLSGIAGGSGAVNTAINAASSTAQSNAETAAASDTRAQIASFKTGYVDPIVTQLVGIPATSGAVNTAIGTAQSNATIAAASNTFTQIAALSSPGGAIYSITSSLASATATLGDVTASYALQVNAVNNGHVAIAGIELVGDASGTSATSEIAFVAGSFKFATYSGGVLNPIIPFTISGTDCFFTGKTYFDSLIGGTIQTGSLNVWPVTSSDGLNVRDYLGNTIIDSAHGLYPGSASFTASTALSGGSASSSTGGGSTVYIGGLYCNFGGRPALTFLTINLFISNTYGTAIYLYIDGVQQGVTYLPSTAATNNYCIDFPLHISGGHTVQFYINAGFSYSGTGYVNWGSGGEIDVIDFKA